MKRRLSLLGSSMAIASLLVFQSNVASAATCVVVADPIQPAIDDPACTAVVLSGGSYTQSVVIDRPLVIDGQGALVNVAETAFTLTNGADVTFRHLSIQAGTGIALSGTSLSRVVVDTATVDGASAAIVIDGPTNGVQILNSVLSSRGRALQAGSGTHANTRIVGNSISAPVDMNLHDSLVEQNAFSGSDTRGCLRLVGDENGTVPSNDVVLRGNTFEKCNPYGVEVGPGVRSLTISRNAFNGGYDGVKTFATALEIQVHQNDFVGNAHAGVYNAVGGPLDATCNWWNSATGPGGIRAGTGDQVSNAVDYAPFLQASFTANPRCGANVHGELPPHDDVAVVGRAKNAGAGKKQEAQAASVGSGGDRRATNGNLDVASVAHADESSAAQADSGCNQAGASPGDVAGIAAVAVVMLARLRRRRV